MSPLRAPGDDAPPDASVLTHVPDAWRLALAVTSDEATAARAVVEGYVATRRRALRWRPGTTPGPRVELLAATHLAAVRRAGRQGGGDRDAEAAAVLLGTGVAAGPAATAAVGFRALPPRWRAAVWLSEVEHDDTATVAAVVDVSAAVALQLTIRGRRALLTRFTQAGEAPPADLGPPLSTLAGPVPDGLGPDADCWRLPLGGRLARRLTATARLDRTPRRLGMAAAAVGSLGLIALGVLGADPGSTSGAALGAVSARSGGASVDGAASGARSAHASGSGTAAELGAALLGVLDVPAGPASGPATSPAAPGRLGAAPGGTSARPVAPTPASGPPTTRLPATVPAVIGSPATGSPAGSSTTSPAVVPPVSVPPISVPPVSVPPVSVPPVSVPPVIVPPVIVPPVIVPPITVPPITVPRITVPPVTVGPVGVTVGGGGVSVRVPPLGPVDVHLPAVTIPPVPLPAGL